MSNEDFKAAVVVMVTVGVVALELIILELVIIMGKL